ncbi:MAG TPA: hypothetical protein VF502_20120 [Stellaceae bacterium]
MSPMTIAGIVLGVIFLGALLGVVLRANLPGHHVEESSKDSVRLVMGLIATMSALVLGLLIASAKSSYDTQSGELVHLAADVIQLDRILAHYGPESLPARARFRDTVERSIDRIWPHGGGRSVSLGLPGDKNESADFYALISHLQPQTSAQRFAQARALEIGAELSRTRVLMSEQTGSSIAWPFLVVLVFWLAILFMGFGMFAPANATVLAALFVGALSVAGAVFLILELDQPYEGLMRLPSAVLRNALAQIGP